MKLAFLPNWCKWLSLALFITAIVLDFDAVKDGIMEGYNSYDKIISMNVNPIPPQMSSQASTGAVPIFDLMIVLSIIVFILSKDKRDDDYFNLIRAKALLMALLFSAFVLISVFMFNRELDGLSLLFIHFLSYLIIFKILKIREDFATNDLE
jgi:hypothetical protein